MQISQALAFVALLAGLAACSSHKTYSANGTTVTTDDADKKVTISTKDGTETMGKDAVDPAKLGVPVYPGATQGQNGLNITAANGSSTQMAVFSTTDSFDKVYDWYSSQLPKESQMMKASSGDSSVAEFSIGSDPKQPAKTTITISGKNDKTEITIVKGSDKQQ
jgi:hypothetical protein